MMSGRADEAHTNVESYLTSMGRAFANVDSSQQQWPVQINDGDAPEEKK